MYHVDLPRIGTFEAWRGKARALRAAGVKPHEVLWTRGEPAGDLFADALPPEGDAPLTVPRGFLDLARMAIWHSDPERFARLYALLDALQTDKRLIEDRADPRVARLNAMAKEVGRDKHKMTAFVRFREVDSDGPRRRFAAWFVPSHFIMEPSAPFFAKRFGDMDWSIFTPDLSAHFDGTVRFDDGAAKPPLPEDATEDLWRTYFRSIFNPARVKVSAMQSEMPKKYWKNLPEASLIPEMIATAQARASAMAEAAPTMAPARAARVTERLRSGQDRVEDALGACRRCALWSNATQAVPGEGPLDAPLMLVGEQPGDREDLTGRPFVGPAGQVLDRALAEVGLAREALYLTNAVKHFKFRPRGKARIHQGPDRGEVMACKWWLALEVERVRPKLIVALGATAVASLTGTGQGLMKRRGTVEATPEGVPVLVTVHPSYLLRLPDAARPEAEALFRADLTLARERIGEMGGAAPRR